MRLQVPAHAERLAAVLTAIFPHGSVATHTPAPSPTRHSSTPGTIPATATSASTGRRSPRAQLRLAVLKVLHLLKQIGRTRFRVRAATVDVRKPQQVARTARKTG